MNKDIKINYGTLFCRIMIGIFIALTIICNVLHFVYFKFSVDAIIYFVISIIICTIFCIIFGFAAGEPLTSLKRKKKKNTHAFHKQLEEEEVVKPIPKKERIKNIFIGLGIFLACGIGYIPLFLLGANSVKKMNSDGYVKTTAVIKYVEDSHGDMKRLAYTYTAEDGKIYTSRTSASFGGASFKAGKTVTIYYNVSSPEAIISPSSTVMTFMGACFFFLGGLFAAIAMPGHAKSAFVGLMFSTIFLMFSISLIVGIQLASGLSFLELIASGVSVYAMLMFGLVGIVLMIITISQIIRNIKFNKFKRNNTEIVQRINERKKLKLENSIKESDKALEAPDSEIVSNPKVEEKKKKPRKKYRHSFHAGLIPLILAGTVFFIAGTCVMILVGIIPTAKYYSYNKTEATITKIDTYHSKRDGSLLATYFYEYEVDGKKYERESSYGQSAELVPTIGSKINIRVNPKNAEDVLDGGFINWIAIILGFIFAGAGVGLFIATVIMSRDGVKKTKHTRSTKKI